MIYIIKYFPKLLVKELFPKVALQSYAPKVISKKAIFQISKVGPQNYSKSIFESSSPKFFLIIENYFPEFLVNTYPKVVFFKASIPQNCSGKLSKIAPKAVPQSCSPKLFPKIVIQNYNPKITILYIYIQNGSLYKAAPEIFSPKLFLKATPRNDLWSCPRKLFLKIVILQNNYFAIIF